MRTIRYLMAAIAESTLIERVVVITVVLLMIAIAKGGG